MLFYALLNVFGISLYVCVLDRILKSLMKGIIDRNTTIRRSYASTIAVITTVAKESTVNKLIQSLIDVYMENEGKMFSLCIKCFL